MAVRPQLLRPLQLAAHDPLPPVEDLTNGADHDEEGSLTASECHMEGGMEMYSLECSCTFHQQCVKNFVHASGGSMESLAAMRCPNCRKDAIEMRESAAAAARLANWAT